MSTSLDELVEMIKAKVSKAGGVEQPIKFVVEGHTPILISKSGVKQEDGEAVLTLQAKLETLTGIFGGTLNPAMAFMSGKIKLDGDLSVAAKIKNILM